MRNTLLIALIVVCQAAYGNTADTSQTVTTVQERADTAFRRCVEDVERRYQPKLHDAVMMIANCRALATMFEAD